MLTDIRCRPVVARSSLRSKTRSSFVCVKAFSSSAVLVVLAVVVKLMIHQTNEMKLTLTYNAVCTSIL
jgi:hypothetical protein